MKPRTLIVSGWGPYREKETVDFTQMESEGLFLVTGATGSGKTTIFDCLTYALYGEVSGSLREKDSLRSDFAPAEIPTFVCLEFVEKGKVYQVTRNPRYQRPKLRGEGTTTETEHGELTCGDQLLASGAQAVTEQIRLLLGLSYHQFKQLSMIAQGEFQQLLTAPSKERTAMFRTIFQTKIYDSITAVLGARVRELTRQIEEKSSRADQLISLFVIDHEQWQSLTAQTYRDLDHIVDFVTQWQESQKGKQKQLELLCQQQEDSYKELIGSLEKARTQNQQIGAYLEQQNRFEALKKEHKQLEQQLKAVQKEQDQLPVLQREVEQDTLLKSGLEHQMEGLKQWQKQKLQLQMHQQVYLELDEKAKAQKYEYEQMDDAYKKAAAGILAQGLSPGQPCPVCGALTHPKKAPLEAKAPDEAGLRRAKERAELAISQASGAQSQAAASLAALQVMERQLCDLPLEQGVEQVLAQTEGHWQQLTVKIRENKTRILEIEKACKQALVEMEKSKSVIEQLKAAMVRPKTLEPVDTEVLSQSIQKAEVERKQLLHSKEQTLSWWENNQRAFSALKDLKVQQEQLKSVYGYLREVERAASGYNSRNLVLEQYVLSVYLDEILKAANLRLSTMTAGRYELFRVKETKDRRTREGMELEVLDQYTGKKRSVRSLSGGESFHAALALALGSSDVIQSYAGGIWVETLFVDEGFGSLDSQSLDLALDVLSQLCGGNRMIGIISHVDELKERISSQIIVEKTSGGSRILTKNML